METQTQTRLVDTVGEGEVETYTLPCVKWMASGKSLCDSGSLSPVLCDSLWGRVGWGVRWERGSRRRGHMYYLWLIHADVWQKPTPNLK